MPPTDGSARGAFDGAALLLALPLARRAQTGLPQARLLFWRNLPPAFAACTGRLLAVAVNFLPVSIKKRLKKRAKPAFLRQAKF
jgi:hypothetical protein